MERYNGGTKGSQREIEKSFKVCSGDWRMHAGACVSLRLHVHSQIKLPFLGDGKQGQHRPWLT